MTTLQTDAASTDPFLRKLTIRIPKSYWNAYQPPTSPQTKVSKPTLRKKPRLKLALNAKNPTPTLAPDNPTPRARLTNCKTKLCSFTYGGAKRAVKGAYRNDVAYETPCLQATCVSCRTWHAHLMRDSVPLRDETPSIEPISPDIDPRILDGTWWFTRSRDGSLNSLPSELGLSPVDKAPEYPDIVRAAVESLRARWNIFLPTSLVQRTIATAQVRTQWRSSPRKRWTARLRFTSWGGKENFRDIVQMRERKRGYDRLYRRMKGGKVVGVDKGEGEDVERRRARGRQRVRLVFGSQRGKREYGRLIERSGL
jgi:hypothetical protein